MAMLLPAETMNMNNAIFHFWMRECHTRRFLLVRITLCFSKVTVMRWRVDWTLIHNAIFRCWMRDCHTPRYLQVVVIQCFFVVMAMLLLVERICLEDAAFHLWMKYLTSRFLQASLTLCFSEVMAAFRRAEAIVNDSATFHRSNPAISTSVTQCRLAETSSCNFMLFVKLIHTFWRSNLAGQALLCFHAAGSSLASDTQKHIAQGLKVKLDCLRVVLGDGQLLASICAAHPVATVEEVFHQTSSQ